MLLLNITHAFDNLIIMSFESLSALVKVLVVNFFHLETDTHRLEICLRVVQSKLYWHPHGTYGLNSKYVFDDGCLELILLKLIVHLLYDRRSKV